jgi:hypothetical protein
MFSAAQEAQLSLAPNQSATTAAFKHQAATILSGVALNLT